MKILNKENEELSKNLASYLSLAAIEYTRLMVPYIDIILNSLLSGNYSLARVVLQLYEISSESAIITRTRQIIDIIPKCDTIDKNILLQLIATISATNHGIALLIIDKLPQFFDLCLTSSTATQALMVLLRLAEKKPTIFHEYIGLLIMTAQKMPNTICLVGQILSAVGRANKEKAQVALEFIMENLHNIDRPSQTILLQEAVKLCSQYPILFNEKLTSVIRQRNLSQQFEKSMSTSGNVTIVNINSGPPVEPPRPSQNTQSAMKSQNVVSPTTTISQQQQTATVNGHQKSSMIPLSSNQNPTRRINNAHRSMTRLSATGVNSSNLGGLHKSMTRLSSSSSHFISPTIPPPLSQNVMLTGENKWGLPSTKITSCGVTVNHVNHTSPIRMRQSTLGSIGKSSSNGLSALNQSTGSISMQNNISVHHAQSFTNEGPFKSPRVVLDHSEGPFKSNKSVTLLNVNSSNVNHRMSVFEPSMRDTIQHFCEKHLDKIKAYMKTVEHRLPLCHTPAKVTIEERRAKKFAKLHFACQARADHCLYSKTFFSMRTRHAKVWIHLMFLDLQSRSEHALSSYDTSVSSLKHCWDTLKFENRTSFITLVTSAFPPVREQDALINELRNSGFFDVFEIGPMGNSSMNLDDVRWGCFLWVPRWSGFFLFLTNCLHRCNHPEKAVFLENNTQPVIEGQLKEKKGKWRLFRRWRTRYFTLSGAHLSCKGSVRNLNNFSDIILIVILGSEWKRVHRYQSNTVRQGITRSKHPNLLRNLHVYQPDTDIEAYRRRESRRVGAIFVNRSRKTFPSTWRLQQDKQPAIQWLAERNQLEKSLLTLALSLIMDFYGDGTL